MMPPIFFSKVLNDIAVILIDGVISPYASCTTSSAIHVKFNLHNNHMSISTLLIWGGGNESKYIHVLKSPRDLQAHSWDHWQTCLYASSFCAYT